MADREQQPISEEEPDFPIRIADAIESVANRARSMTVDRAENIGKWVATGTILFFIAVIAFIFLLIGLVRLLGEVVGVEVAYAIIGGLFLLAALLIWRQRDPKETPDA